MKINLKHLTLMVVLLSSFVGVKANAAAYDGQADTFVVDEKANQEAIKIVKEFGELENCPVPLENLTTQKTSGEIEYIKKSKGIQDRASRKIYNIDKLWLHAFINNVWAGDTIQCNELVPTGYNHAENGIFFSWVETGVSSSSAKFMFIPAFTEDTGVGGYGTGGWYWREFRIYKTGDYGNSDNVWLSTWNKDHLIYG